MLCIIWSVKRYVVYNLVS